MHTHNQVNAVIGACVSAGSAVCGMTVSQLNPYLEAAAYSVSIISGLIVIVPRVWKLGKRFVQWVRK